MSRRVSKIVVESAREVEERPQEGPQNNEGKKGLEITSDHVTDQSNRSNSCLGTVWGCYLTREEVCLFDLIIC